jgi:hypothetical protein
VNAHMTSLIEHYYQTLVALSVQIAIFTTYAELNFTHFGTSLNRTGGFPFMRCCFGAQN